MGSGTSTRRHLLAARVLPVMLSTLALLAFASTPIRTEAATTATPSPTCSALDLLGACLDVLPGVLAPTPAATPSAQPTAAPTAAASRAKGTTVPSTPAPAPAPPVPAAAATPAATPAAAQTGVCVQTVLSLCVGDGSLLSVGGLGPVLPLPDQCLPLSLLCTCPDSASVGGPCSTPSPPTPAPTPRPTVKPTAKPSPGPTSSPPDVVAVVFGSGGLGPTSPRGPGGAGPVPQSPLLGALEAPVGTRTVAIDPIPGLQLGSPLVLWPLFVILDTLAVMALVWFGRRSWAASHRA